MTQDTLNTVDILLLSALLFVLIIQLIYYWIFLAKPYFYRKKAMNGKISFSDSQPPVSIILYARDDSENLGTFLPSILEQNYPEFEVIVINDDSSDNSENVLKRLKTKYNHLYYTYIPQGTKNLSRKKLGLTLGIKAAKFDVLLFVDADSRPASENWIKNISRHFDSKKKIVLGFNILDKRNGFMNEFAAYDYFFSNLQMITSALLKFPYGANGRNLAYKKEYFEQQKGYFKYRQFQAGEDDLFVNDIASKENIAVEFSPESTVITRWDEYYDWKYAKINRATTQYFYKKMPVLFWRIESWSRFFFLLLFFSCIFYHFGNIILPLSAILAFAIRLFSLLFVINKTAGCLKLKKSLLLVPFFDVMQPIVNIYFYIYKLFATKTNYIWKYEK